MEQESPDPTWDWADSIDARALRRMARVCLPLLKEPERWINRRVERIYFKDYWTARHQVSVDFTLPPTLPPISTLEQRDIFAAPLFLLRKSPDTPMYEGRLPRKRFVVFGARRRRDDAFAIPSSSISAIDFLNQDAQRQPLLTRQQSRLLATMILLESAHEITGDAIDGELRRALWAIANWEWEDLGQPLKYLFAENLASPDPRQQLRADTAFRELAYALASHSVIACLFEGRPPRRAIYKLVYDEPLPPGSALRRMGRSFGWFSEKLFVPLNEIGAGSSYHVEVTPPDELDVNATGLYGHGYEFFRDEPGSLSEAQLEYDILQVARAVSGEIYIPEPLPGRRVGGAWVKLRASQRGFLRGALIAALITTAVLWAAFAMADHLLRTDRSDAAVALLLLMPAVLAAYVARSGEHAITTRMLFWARILLVVDAALPFVAALLLMTTPSTPSTDVPLPLVRDAAVRVLDVRPAQLGGPQKTAQRRIARDRSQSRRDVRRLQAWWKVLAVVSLVLVAQFSATYFIPRPHGETRYRPRRGTRRVPPPA